MKTITLTIPDNAEITVDGKPYPLTGEVKLWAPKPTESYWFLAPSGYVVPQTYTNNETHQYRIKTGNVFPTHEHDEAADRLRRAQSVIDRYFYAKGIDTRWKEGIRQYGAFFSHGNLCSIERDFVCDGSPFYVESKAVAEQAIADIPDAIRTVLMRGWV